MTERKTVRKACDGRVLAPTDPSELIELVVKSATVEFTNGQCRAINAAEDGTVDIVLPNGTVIEDYQMHKGYNPISIVRVHTGGDDIVMWALF